MYKAKTSSNITNAFSFSKYQSQILNFIGFIILSLISTSSFAFLANPGANCTGITGASQGSLTSADYTKILSSLDSFVDVEGNAAGSIPLQVKMSIVESSANTVARTLRSSTISDKTIINVTRDFPNAAASTDITFEFRNSITLQPIFLRNVALSAFDIDYSNTYNTRFYDLIRFTGINSAKATIPSVQQTVEESFLNTNQESLFTRIDFNCPANSLDKRCQGSVQFPEPVRSVTMTYTNTGFSSTTTTSLQEIDFSIDNYCYVPQYIFSGTVFDDNGGIPAGSADKDNADIMTPSSVYANRSNYFNGLFNPSQELGISGSTVRLVNCAKTNTTYAQSVIGSGATIGQYQFSVPISTFDGITNLCIVEERAPTIFPFYPIRTTTDNLNTGFAATKYNYPNNNFGRVIPANAALVLEKEQAPNNCNITSLTDSSLKYSKSPLSSSGDNPDIRPGQCIAYRITATNRANMPIDNFIMQDALQKKDANNATVTSVLTSPAREANVFNDGLSNGQNGTIKTISQTLPKRDKRLFYFNTKYGSTVNAQ
ncbi:hypothetical protein HQR03_05845 [Psychrobacter okhotskensis]|uniref:hypothetical protein n=1 Tax=Psychrobacter okhotskensis TaxID=212403 RepID=UPI001565D196|nr:hypothetical protein [Psychrobacter okhotskensis]NRD70059.1 hypothetical protein [Psychrobacter okhotskensis]